MVGFDARNKDILDPKFICPFCSLILCDPVQLRECGHRQCQSCIDIQNRTTIKCPQCSEETQPNKMMIDKGFRRDMRSVPIDCSFCQWTGVLNNYQKHLDEFHSNPKCEHCDKQFHSVNALNQHTVSQCQKLSIDCVLKSYGCNERIVREKMQEHYLTQQHQAAVLKVVRQKLESQMNTDVSSPPPPTTTTNATTTHLITDPLNELNEAINVLSAGIQALHNDGQKISDEALQNQIQLQNLTEDISKLQLSVEESHGFLEGMKHNQDIVHQEATSLKEKINDMQHISYDGTFVWKITNFKEKMRDAQSERQTSIYSPPFYSSKSGYKMRARLYLYGNGNAPRTYMSIFFILMIGLHDPILKFPFNYKIAFCMYDQTNAQRHIIDSFRPDIKSNSFQRPRSEMNIASGISKFVPLPTILQEGNPYVRDDTMFIKIMVDFSDLPKTLLSYALSLNPGLPYNVQQTMIKREKERRANEKYKLNVEANDPKR